LSNLVNASRCMRCFSNVPANCAFAQYSDCQYDVNDSGDGGGVPVFKWLSILEFGGFTLFFHAYLDKRTESMGLFGHAKKELPYLNFPFKRLKKSNKFDDISVYLL
jgi:hypothetical protein